MTCECVERSRTSPHDDVGNDLEARRVEIIPQRFKVAWNAARRLLQASAELVHPPADPDEIIVDDDGNVRCFSTCRTTLSGPPAGPVQYWWITSGQIEHLRKSMDGP